MTFDRDELLKLQKKLVDADMRTRVDADGKLHKFFEFRPLDTGVESTPMDQRAFITSEAKTQAFCGSNRCISGDTIVSTDGRTVRELVESGVQEFECVSWDGHGFRKATAVKPFLKGFDRLNRVSLKNGLSFRATNEHRVLSPNGWVRVGDRPSEIIGLDGVVSVEKIEDDAQENYYDLSVPGFDNYLAAGVVHHNSGKTLCGDQKEVIWVRGKDPLRPSWRAPKVSDREFVVWHCVPAEFTRETLRNIVMRIPPDMPHKVYRSHGDEHVRFPPSELRPHGAVIRIKSYGMSQDHFQFEAVDIVRFDEEPPEYIWEECEQRLVSTSGMLWLTLTPKNGTTWLYKKLYKLDSDYRCAQSGKFAWFKASQLANPHLKREDIDLRSADLSEDSYAIRVLGDYVLLQGSRFFDKDGSVLKFIYKNFVKDPEWYLTFDAKGVANFEPYSAKLNGGWDVYEQPVPGYKYVIGADASKGTGGDFSAAHILCANTNEQVAVFHSNRIEPIEFGFELFLAAKFYNYALVAPEVNFDGSALLHGLKQNGYGNIYRRQSFGGRIDQAMNSLGWFTDKRSKYPALEELRVALARSVDRRPGGIIVHCAKTLKELDNYGHLKEHRQGSYGFGALDGHDDLAMALAITIQALHQSPIANSDDVPEGLRRAKRGLFDDAMEHARNMRDRKEAFEELGSESGAYFQDRF